MLYYFFMDKLSKKFAFVLGRESELCLDELGSILSRLGFCFDIYNVSKNITFINMEREIDSSKLENFCAISGGVIKVFQIVNDQLNNITPDRLSDIILENKSDRTKIDFGISSYCDRYSTLATNRLGFAVKNLLKKGHSSRFVMLKETSELSSVVTANNNLVGKGIELGIFGNGVDNLSVGKLISVTNYREWSDRDYGKPRSDKRSGMLPPKLARMMINIALGYNGNSKDQVSITNQISNSNFQSDEIVIDPFCGSGNIPMESMMLGLDFWATDNSETAVSDTTMNCQWLKQKNKIEEVNYKIELADATTFNFAQKIEQEPIFSNKKNIFVVAEPYLGEPKKFQPSMNAALGEYRKISELYLKFLDNIKKMATDGKQLVLCLVFPLVETADKGLFSLWAHNVDEIKKIGYTVLQSPLVYGRDYQVVKREIVLLGTTESKDNFQITNVK